MPKKKKENLNVTLEKSTNPNRKKCEKKTRAVNLVSGGCLGEAASGGKEGGASKLSEEGHRKNLCKSLQKIKK